MLSPRLTNCPECSNIPDLLKKINCKLAELGNSLYNNISYMLNQPIPAGEMLQLIAYRRILTHKYCNPDYVHEYSVAMIASRVIRITAGCVSRCNEPERCLEDPCDIDVVANPTTTSTTTGNLGCKSFLLYNTATSTESFLIGNCDTGEPETITLQGLSSVCISTIIALNVSPNIVVIEKDSCTTTTTTTIPPSTTTTTSSSSTTTTSTSSSTTTSTTTATPTTTTTTTVTSVLTVPTNRSPVRAVFDSNGNYFVSCFSAISLTKVTPSGSSSVFSNLLYSSPWGITIDSSDNLYVAAYNGACVYKITPSGVATVLGTTGMQPTAIAIDSLNNIYTVNQGPNTVTKITPAGVSTTFASLGSDQSLYMVVDSSDNLYISDEVQNVVRKVTPLGMVTIFASAITSARGMVFDSSENLYVCASSTIKKITPSGVISTFATIPYILQSQIEDLAIDSVGNIYCSDAGVNRVYKIDTLGNLGFYGNTGRFPITVDVSPLDEVIWTANNIDDTVTIFY
jgi:sugar lactone lactonase YvrE